MYVNQNIIPKLLLISKEKNVAFIYNNCHKTICWNVLKLTWPDSVGKGHFSNTLPGKLEGFHDDDIPDKL
uniref:Uncharacterized protein n=1 Tax=Timema genevievae TaxID=629358 RepID=A0A7R9PR42_TIMGE|nr:unnamed protein product [Timema genevievae]